MSLLVNLEMSLTCHYYSHDLSFPYMLHVRYAYVHVDGHIMELPLFTSKLQGSDAAEARQSLASNFSFADARCGIRMAWEKIVIFSVGNGVFCGISMGNGLISRLPP